MRTVVEEIVDYVEFGRLAPPVVHVRDALGDQELRQLLRSIIHWWARESNVNSKLHICDSRQAQFAWVVEEVPYLNSLIDVQDGVCTFLPSVQKSEIQEIREHCRFQRFRAKKPQRIKIYNRFVEMFEHGKITEIEVRNALLDLFVEVPDDGIEFLQNAPSAIVNLFYDWSSDYPQDTNHWEEYMSKEIMNLSSNGCHTLSLEEKLATKKIVECVRQFRSKNH